MTLSSPAVVRPQVAHALAGQPVHRLVARLAPTLSLLRPAVDGAAGELVAGQELTGVGLVGCNRRAGLVLVEGSVLSSAAGRP